MFLLSFVVAGLAIGLLRGGSLQRLAGVPLKSTWLVPLAFVVQFVSLSAVFDASRLVAFAPWVHVFSYLLLLLAVLVNLHLRTLWVFGFGLALNLAVIMANGGYMPVSLDQLAAAGHAARAEEIRAAGHSMNAQALTPETRLAFLGDVMAVPSPVPLSNVFSVGDVFIGIGALALVYVGMTGKGGDGPYTL